MCNSLAQANANFATENKNTCNMKSTDFNLEALSSLFSSENAYSEMMDMVRDLGLVLTEVSAGA